MSIESKNNHIKAYWGPRLWYLLHKISYQYPDMPGYIEQQFYLNYFNVIRFIIPCPYCAAHFKLSMELKPIRFSVTNRNALKEWFRQLHNDINIENGKRIYQSYELDSLYGTSDFKHELFNQLVDYMYELVVYNKMNRRLFLHWLIMTYNIHPCVSCKMKGLEFIMNNPIEYINYTDNSIVNTWLDGLRRAVFHYTE